MRDRPHPQHKLEWPGGVVPEWAKPQQRLNKRRGKGGKGERNGGSSPGKRERLQKVMAQSGHGSRRNIEILIAQGHITINGQVAKLGDSVGPGDKVKLDGNLINLRFGDPLPRVLVYHKTTGEIVSRDDPQKRPTVFDRLPKVNGARWVSVGRLDFNTEGLLIFTTSGELANRLTHPRFEVEREYAVRLLGELTEETRQKLLAGVDIDGESCKFDSIEDRGGEGANHWYHVVLREGKNREVRRMMEAVGLTVSRLMRVRFGCVELPSHVKRGQIREMDEEQVQNLLNFAGMNEPPPAAAAEEAEEDPLDNIGNRAPEPSRRHQERVIDDDAGNRFNPREAAPEREADGNRGTYGEGYKEPKHDHRSQAGGGKSFSGFGGKKRGGRGEGQGQGGMREANGNVARGPGNMGRNGNAAGEGNGNVQGEARQHQHNPHNPQQRKPRHGGPPQPQGEGQGTPGGKHGRHRRHKNRNRNRNRGAAGNEAGPAQGPVSGGEREPG